MKVPPMYFQYISKVKITLSKGKGMPKGIPFLTVPAVPRKIGGAVLDKSAAEGIRYEGTPLGASLQKYEPAAIPLPAEVPLMHTGGYIKE